MANHEGEGRDVGRLRAVRSILERLGSFVNMNARRLVGLICSALVALASAADETTDLLMPGVIAQVLSEEEMAGSFNKKRSPFLLLSFCPVGNWPSIYRRHTGVFLGITPHQKGRRWASSSNQPPIAHMKASREELHSGHVRGLLVVMKSADGRSSSLWRFNYQILGFLYPEEPPLESVTIREETYVCTSVPLDPETEHYLTGYKANYESHNAHHILLFGCDEPGSDDEVW
ncbi:unnamed protein product [Nippostrongylus brasiliensis]|uniref:Cu2_monooxygen domain-containing protein n=1 Tax=Nippostrongylus brasiliensis TaxID=27835 RepID=A0A158QWZ9_NIPBR|nr:unnamed protein product [Nippostrongylus brasiliensis]